MNAVVDLAVNTYWTICVCMPTINNIIIMGACVCVRTHTHTHTHTHTNCMLNIFIVPKHIHEHPHHRYFPRGCTCMRLIISYLYSMFVNVHSASCSV